MGMLRYFILKLVPSWFETIPFLNNYYRARGHVFSMCFASLWHRGFLLS